MLPIGEYAGHIEVKGHEYQRSKNMVVKKMLFWGLTARRNRDAAK